MLTLEQAKRWYTHTDAVHDFSHIERVYALAERLGEAEKADMEILLTAVLLHDADGATPGSDTRKEHHLRSAEFAESILRSEDWQEERIRAVLHCIRAHRYRGDQEAPQTIEAMCLFDADKLDVMGAIGAVRTVVYAALAGTPFYKQPSRQFIETGRETPGELHSAYHEYLFKLRNIEERMYTRAGKGLAETRHQVMADFFDQLQAETAGEC